MNDEANEKAGEETLTTEALERYLSDDAVNSTSLEYLFSFGQVLMDELHARLSLVDAKANSLLGWSAAFVAFLLVGPGRPNDAWGADGFLYVVGTISGVAASVASALALRVRDWKWPSPHDWFQVKHLASPDSLLCGHVLSLYEAHENAGEILDRKAAWLSAAQYVLLFAIGCILVVIILGLAATT
jgi:hypothetical protein